MILKSPGMSGVQVNPKVPSLVVVVPIGRELLLESKTFIVTETPGFPKWLLLVYMLHPFALAFVRNAWDTIWIVGCDCMLFCSLGNVGYSACDSYGCCGRNSYAGG